MEVDYGNRARYPDVGGLQSAEILHLLKISTFLFLSFPLLPVVIVNMRLEYPEEG